MQTTARYGFVLNPEKEAALTGHANMEWKYKYTEMRGKYRDEEQETAKDLSYKQSFWKVFK